MACDGMKDPRRRRNVAIKQKRHRSALLDTHFEQPQPLAVYRLLLILQLNLNEMMGEYSAWDTVCNYCLVATIGLNTSCMELK